MKSVIYYPSFEVQDHDWLKFALLYIERLKPIIPESADCLLSDDFREVTDESDLIEKYRPSQVEGRNATLDAIELIERILRYPNDYRDVFEDTDYIEKWKHKNDQDFTLFQEKYSEPWKKFCLENHLGKENDYGIAVSHDLANTYMTILAQCISDSQGVSSITDCANMDRFSILARAATKQDTVVASAAKTIIEIELPSHLRDIDIRTIYNLRSREDFKEKQRAFHTELSAMLDAEQEKLKITDFKERVSKCKSDLSQEFSKIAAETTTLALGCWLLFKSPILHNPDIAVAEKLAGGAAIALGSTIAIRKFWKHTRTRRLARRYLADLHSPRIYN